MLPVFPTAPVTLLFLAVATYYDLRYREVDWRLFPAAAPAVLAAYSLLSYTGLLDATVFTVNLVHTCIAAVVAYLLARAGIMGYGDVPLIAVVGLLNPYLVFVGPLPLTPLAATLLLGSVYPVAVAVANVLHNVRRLGAFRELTGGTGLPVKLYYLLAGRVMTVEEFRRGRFNFPLVTGEERRLIARVGREPLRGDEYTIRGRYLIASHGFAFALLLLVGYTLTLTLLPPAS